MSGLIVGTHEEHLCSVTGFSVQCREAGNCEYRPNKGSFDIGNINDGSVVILFVHTDVGMRSPTKYD